MQVAECLGIISNHRFICFRPNEFARLLPVLFR